jgi:hypothetical protein
MSCCACDGFCNHVGPHYFCLSHGGGGGYLQPAPTTDSGTLRWINPPPANSNVLQRLEELILEKSQLEHDLDESRRVNTNRTEECKSLIAQIEALRKLLGTTVGIIHGEVKQCKEFSRDEVRDTRCVLELGHDDEHRNGFVSWGFTPKQD